MSQVAAYWHHEIYVSLNSKLGNNKEEAKEEEDLVVGNVAINPRSAIKQAGKNVTSDCSVLL